ncbi:MAG TPA: hypothetical protein PLO31_07630 [Dysgonamonadaceae bacterium]|nr:hypothetical protein [Dysgonamonadaceae bacterium]
MAIFLAPVSRTSPLFSGEMLPIATTGTIAKLNTFFSRSVPTGLSGMAFTLVGYIGPKPI